MRTIGLLLIVLLLSVIPAQAQENEVTFPLLVYLDGWVQQMDDITATPERLFEAQYPRLALSPAGDFLAYSDITEGFEVVAGGSEPPTDIFIYDRSTGESILVAGQPENPGDLNRVLRNAPVWSPDGQEFAYVEYIIDNGNYGFAAHVRAYNVSTGETRTITETLDMGYQDAGISIPVVSWSEIGIIQFGSTPDFAGGTFNRYVMIYDPITSAEQYYEIGEYELSSDNFVRQYISIEYNDAYWLAFEQKDGIWQYYNPETGETLHDRAAPVRLPLTGDLVYTPAPFENRSGDITYELMVSDTSGELGRLPYIDTYLMDFRMPLISPDGRNTVYTQSGQTQVYDWNTNEESVLIETSFPDRALAWAPSRWVDSASACSLPPRLAAGMTAYVDPAMGANNVREMADSSSTRIGQLEPDAEFTVRSGPVCADGYFWFEITAGDLTGWTAEGSNGKYWLIPS